MIVHVKAENLHRSEIMRNAATVWFIFHDFPRSVRICLYSLNRPVLPELLPVRLVLKSKLLGTTDAGIFSGQIPFLSYNQQHHSTEGIHTQWLDHGRGTVYLHRSGLRRHLWHSIRSWRCSSSVRAFSASRCSRHSLTAQTFWHRILVRPSCHFRGLHKESLQRSNREA